jgi:phenylacetate-CoA ligase
VEVVDSKIIGTGFTNSAMPMFRYDTEDGGCLSPAPCSCDLPFPWLDNIKGRWDQALLWGKDGEPISTSALNFHDPVFLNFDRFQFRQEEPGRATLLVTRLFEADNARGLLVYAQKVLQERVGDTLAIDIRLTGPESLLSDRGKVVTVDQRYHAAVDNSYYD